MLQGSLLVEPLSQPLGEPSRRRDLLPQLEGVEVVGGDGQYVVTLQPEGLALGGVVGDPVGGGRGVELPAVGVDGDLGQPVGGQEEVGLCVAEQDLGYPNYFLDTSSFISRLTTIAGP